MAFASASIGPCKMSSTASRSGRSCTTLWKNYNRTWTYGWLGIMRADLIPASIVLGRHLGRLFWIRNTWRTTKCSTAFQSPLLQTLFLRALRARLWLNGFVRSSLNYYTTSSPRNEQTPSRLRDRRVACEPIFGGLPSSQKYLPTEEKKSSTWTRTASVSWPASTGGRKGFRYEEARPCRSCEERLLAHSDLPGQRNFIPGSAQIASSSFKHSAGFCCCRKFHS